MRTREVIVGEAMAGCTVQQVLHRAFGMSASYVSSLKFRPGGIQLNGGRVNSSVRVRPGDIVSARIDDEGGENRARPIPYPLSFVYEDADLAVLDKPAGMVVHGADGGACTVANALAAHWGSEQTFHPVNRLDRGTSGLMVVARSAYVHDRLRRALPTEDFVREYWGAARGRVEPARGIIDRPIAERQNEPRRVDEQGKRAVTEYEVTEWKPGYTLLSLRLHTGRTHQLRAHLASLGHGLLGDTDYGAPAGEAPGRPALHAARLRFVHPVSGERLELCAPLPQELRELL